jgi:L-lactate dehydrogenase complex protein LldG
VAAALMERTAFLARLGGARPGPALPDVTALPDVHTELRAGEDPFTRFAAELADVSGTCEQCSPDAVPAAVVAALGAARAVALADDLAAFTGPVREALAAAGLEPVAYAEVAADRERLGALEATVTGCAVAVASTGSIMTTGGAGRAAALIAPLHVCVVAAGQLVGGLAEALQRMPAGSMAALQSGPSRTADIEKTLILGMHGPGATHVILADRPLPEFLDPSPETA